MPLKIPTFVEMVKDPLKTKPELLFDLLLMHPAMWRATLPTFGLPAYEASKSVAVQPLAGDVTVPETDELTTSARLTGELPPAGALTESSATGITKDEVITSTTPVSIRGSMATSRLHEVEFRYSLGQEQPTSASSP